MLVQKKPACCSRNIFVLSRPRLRLCISNIFTLDRGCVTAINPQGELDIVGEEDLQADAKVLVSDIKGICTRRKKTLWYVPLRLCPIQLISAHITHFVSNCFTKALLYEMGKELPLSQLQQKWRGWFYTTVVVIFLAITSDQAGVTLKQLLIRDWHVVLGILSASRYSHGMVAGCYYGSLVHAYRQQSTTLTHREQL